MTQNNDIISRITQTSAPSTPKEEAIVSETRVVTAKYKVFSAILLVVGVCIFMSRGPDIKSKYDATNTVYDSTKQEVANKKIKKAGYEQDKKNLEKIEANQTTIETCLNLEDTTACTSLPDEWNVEYKGKIIKDFSIPLSYLQLHSLFTEKMPVDEQKVLRNLNEYLIRDGVAQGIPVKNGDIKSINISDPTPVEGSAVLFEVPLSLSIEFDRVEDLISFVHNVEKKLISVPNDRILYKIQEVGYDIISSDKAQTTAISMIAYYYHDPRFEEVEIPENLPTTTGTTLTGNIQ
ncbi:MAG: hypothetical protein LBO09_05110 [Candidatus Peribacteria bacterium]|jgi:hypothetical protein|nr:hypothetical protein [Candidatus Peribacteria bacterium]